MLEVLLPLSKEELERAIQEEEVLNLSMLKHHGFQTDEQGGFDFYTGEDTPILAVGDGTVTEIYRYTPKEIVDHSHKTNIAIDLGNKVTVWYTHVRPSVKEGDIVKGGQEIGKQYNGFGEGIKHFHLLFGRKSDEEYEGHQSKFRKSC